MNVAFSRVTTFEPAGAAPVGPWQLFTRSTKDSAALSTSSTAKDTNWALCTQQLAERHIILVLEVVDKNRIA